MRQQMLTIPCANSAMWRYLEPKQKLRLEIGHSFLVACADRVTWLLRWSDQQALVFEGHQQAINHNFSRVCMMPSFMCNKGYIAVPVPCNLCQPFHLVGFMSAAVYLKNCSTMWTRPSFMWYIGCIIVLLLVHCIYIFFFFINCFY